MIEDGLIEIVTAGKPGGKRATRYRWSNPLNSAASADSPGPAS